MCDTRDFDTIGDEDGFQDLGSDADLFLDGIKDPIDRLYKVSTWIRNPSSRFASSKALHHQEIDNESNVDLPQTVADFDHDYVSSVFLQYRKSKALQDDPKTKPSTQKAQDDNAYKLWEPIQSVLSQHRSEILEQKESFLVHRIARANMYRRQQFAYWKKYRDELSNQSTTALQCMKTIRETRRAEILPEKGIIKPPPLAEPPTTLSITNANHLQTSQFTIKDDESQTSVSEYAPSISSDNQEIVDFPPAPKLLPGAKFFKCPYCFTLCHTAVSSQKAWE